MKIKNDIFVKEAYLNYNSLQIYDYLAIPRSHYHIRFATFKEFENQIC
jgi:hypothetical protein